MCSSLLHWQDALKGRPLPPTRCTQAAFGQTSFEIYLDSENAHRARLIPAERGAETSIMLASDPAYQSVTGRYFDQGKEVSAANIALMLRRKRRCGAIVCALLGLEEPRYSASVLQ